jgi:hypothetical protein
MDSTGRVGSAKCRRGCIGFGVTREKMVLMTKQTAKYKEDKEKHGRIFAEYGELAQAGALAIEASHYGSIKTWP